MSTTTTSPGSTEPPIPTLQSSAQLLAWVTIVVPIGAWTIHIVALASLVELTCEHPSVEWVMHGLTAGLGLACIACIALAWRMARLPNGEEAGSDTANVRFLSHLGLFVAIINLALIAAEGIYVVFIETCARV
jgi:hypothetical protein